MMLRRNVLSLVVACSLLLSAFASAGLATAAPGTPKHTFTPGTQEGSAGNIMGGSVIARGDGIALSANVPLEQYLIGRYVVEFSASAGDAVALTDKLAAQLGFKPTFVYNGAFRGFAAKLSSSAVASLEARDDIKRVERDEVAGQLMAQTIPNGIKRMGTLLNKWAKINGADERANVDVAVVDTGVDMGHPDLNVSNWADCTSTSGNGMDQLGHGTHVAGTIGALDNGIGVVGVAPGARIWNLRIFDASGGTTTSAILCAQNLTVQYASQIDVANHSWGGEDFDGNRACSFDSIHQSFCNVVNAGVTVVVAAGNSSSDADFFTPASYSQVITVSSIADTDGRIGGKGGANTDGDPDDSLSYFSNYGRDVDLAAPGSDIFSTCPRYLTPDCGVTNYGLMSGTSMASPHVAGAAALYIARYGRVGPSAVKAGLQRTADRVKLKNDPDGFTERSVYLGPINPQCTVAGTSGAPNTTVTLTCKYFRADEKVDIRWNSATGNKIKGTVANTSGNFKTTFLIPNSSAGSRKIFAIGQTSKASDDVGFTVTSSVNASSTSGAAGDAIRLDLRGFGARTSIQILWDGEGDGPSLKSNIRTSATGSTSTITIRVPEDATPGVHTITVIGSDGTTVTFEYTVTGDETTPEATPETTPETTPEATPEPSETPVTDPTPVETPVVEPTEQPTEAPTDVPTEEATTPPAVETPEATAEPAA